MVTDVERVAITLLAHALREGYVYLVTQDWVKGIISDLDYQEVCPIEFDDIAGIAREFGGDRRRDVSLMEAVWLLGEEVISYRRQGRPENDDEIVDLFGNEETGGIAIRTSLGAEIVHYHMRVVAAERMP